MIKVNFKKVASFILALLIIFVIISSIGYIVTHTNHHCTGEDCPVCLAIHTAQKTLEIIGTTVVITVFAILPNQISTLLLSINSLFIIKDTSLFSQKVKLNN